MHPLPILSMAEIPFPTTVWMVLKLCKIMGYRDTTSTGFPRWIEVWMLLKLLHVTQKPVLPCRQALSLAVQQPGIFNVAVWLTYDSHFVDILRFLWFLRPLLIKQCLYNPLCLKTKWKPKIRIQWLETPTCRQVVTFRVPGSQQWAVDHLWAMVFSWHL